MWTGIVGPKETCGHRIENGERPYVRHRRDLRMIMLSWGRITSLIETAKVNRIEPFAYIKATLKVIAAGHPQSRIEDLLPWNFKAST